MAKSPDQLFCERLERTFGTLSEPLKRHLCDKFALRNGDVCAEVRNAIDEWTEYQRQLGPVKAIFESMGAEDVVWYAEDGPKLSFTWDDTIVDIFVTSPNGDANLCFEFTPKEQITTSPSDT